MTDVELRVCFGVTVNGLSSRHQATPVGPSKSTSRSSDQIPPNMPLQTAHVSCWNFRRITILYMFLCAHVHQQSVSKHMAMSTRLPKCKGTRKPGACSGKPLLVEESRLGSDSLPAPWKVSRRSHGWKRGRHDWSRERSSLPCSDWYPSVEPIGLPVVFYIFVGSTWCVKQPGGKKTRRNTSPDAVTSTSVEEASAGQARVRPRWRQAPL